jgi:hypothetical protein
MNAAVPEARTSRRGLELSSSLDFSGVAIWLVASLIALFFALILRDSTVIGDVYLPRGNDSFYHARRILDAAVGARGFYQFDERLHAPDGAWISWPWAYDYLLAQVTRVALWAEPLLDPMVVLIYAPVAWLFVNSALFLAAAGAIGLSREMRVLAMLCFALSPLTQLLHGIGMVDHHYVEHTFVLLTVWLGLRWFKHPADHRRAVTLAVTLGVATAFHNGLFILQLLPLTAVLVLWLRGTPPPSSTLYRFGIALVVTTQIVLIPSEPYRNWMFEFGLHSWFHLYVAACTACALAFMAWRTFSKANLVWLSAMCAALAVPLGAPLVSGAGFLAGNFSILDQIAEVRSPYEMITITIGLVDTASYYSWLVLLAPVLLAFYAYRVLREKRPDQLYYAIAVIFGLALLLDQFRLHYFGFFALATSGLLLIDWIRARRAWHRGVTFVATFAVIVLAYQPALRERLFLHYAPSSDPEYASTLALFLGLEVLCAEDPGVVLASTDDGNPILFHSDCSVIANNFVLRPEDEAHIDEVARLMNLSPAQIRTERPDVKYVLVRVRDFSIFIDNVAHVVAESPIAKELFIDATPPQGYSLIQTVRRRIGEEGTAGIYAKLFKVTPDADPSGP